MTDSLSIAVHAFASRESMSVFVDVTLFPRYRELQRKWFVAMKT